MITRWLRSCAHCAQNLGPIDLFCEPCWQQILAQIQLQEGHFVSRHFSSSTLWNWGLSADRIERFVRAQKACSLPEARERIAREFFATSAKEWPESFCCVVNDSRTVDHGREWAKAFSKVAHKPYFCLRVESKANHKQKSRKERYQDRQVALEEGYCRWGKSCWFIDDVLTTGATARAVWESLGKPKGFHAVALVYREHRSTLG